MVAPMEQLVTGFWGCFFGAVGMMLAGSVFAFVRSLHRVALNAALAALVSAFFVLAFLGGLPIEDAGTLARFLAHVACAVSALLLYLLFFMLGLFRQARARRCVALALAGWSLAMLLASWLMTPRQALALGSAQACLLGMIGLAFSLRSALRGERLARMAVVGVFSLLLALAGLSWIALDRAHAPWPVHAVSALAATAYLVMIGAVLWARYSYLIELHQIMAYGPGYDPVTRTRSPVETGQMVSAAFRSHQEKSAPLGIIVVYIANLPVLEKLYGLPAVNHALFVCAGRLRHVIPAAVQMGRLANDSFLLLMPDCRDSGRLIKLAHTVQARLSKSVTLHTDSGMASLATEKKEQTRWMANIGVGVLRVNKAGMQAAAAMALGQDISRTAWTYPGRVGWYDAQRGEVVAMPASSGAGLGGPLVQERR